MNKQKLRFFFDYGGYCLWGNNGGLSYTSLSISENLLSEFDALNTEFATSINWDDPTLPSPWTKEDSANFISRANVAYEKLKDELGAEFEITNEVSQHIS